MGEKETAQATKTFTYIGRRVATDGKVKHYWLDEEGETVGFGTGRKLLPAWARIGQRIEFTPIEAGGYSLSGDDAPRNAGQVVDRELVASWQLMDRQAAETAVQESLKRSRRAELNQLIDPLLDFMQHKLSFSQRRAFRHYVADRLAGL